MTERTQAQEIAGLKIKVKQLESTLVNDIIADFNARCRRETNTVLPGLLFATGLLEAKARASTEGERM